MLYNWYHGCVYGIVDLIESSDVIPIFNIFDWYVIYLVSWMRWWHCRFNRIQWCNSNFQHIRLVCYIFGIMDTFMALSMWSKHYASVVELDIKGLWCSSAILMKGPMYMKMKNKSNRRLEFCFVCFVTACLFMWSIFNESTRTQRFLNTHFISNRECVIMAYVNNLCNVH